MNFLKFLIFVGYALRSDASSFNPSIYDRTSNWNVNGQDVYKVHWRHDDTFIYLALEVMTTGWVGFGIADQTSGSMGGSDIVQGYVDSNGNAMVYDRHALSQFPGTTSFQEPITDTCQDWILINGAEVNGKTILELKRKIETGDPQDRPFLFDGETKVVLAYGNDGEDSVNIQHSRGKRKAHAINFAMVNNPDPLHLLLEKDSDVGYFDLLSDWIMTTNDTFKTEQGQKLNASGRGSVQDVDKDTVYVNIFMSIQDKLDTLGDIYVIGMEDVISAHSAEYVHHLGVMDIAAGGQDFSSLWIWAPGNNPMFTYPHCGFLFTNNSGSVLMLNMHYDNPLQKNGYHDTSGVRIYYKKRDSLPDKNMVECGYMLLGQDNLSDEPGQVLSQGKSMYEYTCDSSKTMSWDQPEITVLSSWLHMHGNGRQIWTEQSRNGQLVREINRNDFWDFNLQATKSYANGQIVLKRGDTLKHVCVFDTNNNITKFGLGSKDEMCSDSFVYYPKMSTVSNSACNYDLFPLFSTNRSLGEFFPRKVTNLQAFDYTFGRATQTCDNITSSPTSVQRQIPTASVSVEKNTTSISQSFQQPIPTSFQRPIPTSTSTSVEINASKYIFFLILISYCL